MNSKLFQVGNGAAPLYATPPTPNHSLRAALSVALLSAVLTCTSQAGINGSKIAPPTAHPYGQPMAAWAKEYWSWQVVGQPAAQQFGHVLFPVGPACSITGSGSLADPLIIDICAEFTIKAGTAFALPDLTLIVELYEDGSTDPFPPEEWWTKYQHLTEPIVLDGKTVVTSSEISKYYVRDVYDPPLMYPQPTSYGSVGVVGLQGWMMFVEPMAVGVHELTGAAGAFLPSDNGVFPVEFAEIIRGNWTLNAVP